MTVPQIRACKGQRKNRFIPLDTAPQQCLARLPRALRFHFDRDSTAHVALRLTKTPVRSPG